MFITVDNTLYEVEGSYTIFQFCSFNNINLPCFCYHEKLSIAGNCRICLVEANNALVASCAMPLVDNMRIFTNNSRVKRARESVMEFLLVNHPLDCPICDQGGECDLQDISLTFGSDRGRFYEKRKRSVDNLNCCGPLIKTIMTRCIHCTRCVRFITEVSGVFDFGVLGRGNSMEIGTYLEFFSLDMLSGNVIDICPVGALTSMPFAFTARPWELIGFEGIDILDSLASSIRIDVANNKVMRVVPLLNEDINEEWITNKARFSYDSLCLQRLNYPKLRSCNKFLIISWGSAFNLFVTFLKSRFIDKLKVICGYFSDLRTVLSAKRFFSSVGCSNFYYVNGYAFFIDFRFLFLFNNTIIGLESLNLGLFLGVNLRVELPLLASRLRKSFLNCGAKFYSLGLAVNYLTFPVLNLGNSIKKIFFLSTGKFF